MNKILKLFKNFKRDKSAAIGIGTMIIFIAMVLVAGIAASVLIQTATKLESQAMVTGSETTAEVATGVAVADIQGHANTSAERLDKIAILIRPRAGSFDVDLSTVVLELSDSDNKYILKYDSNNFQSTAAVSGVFSTNAFATLTADDYGVIVLEDADGSISATNPVINRGDKVLLTVNASTTFGSGGIAGRTDIWGRVAPENGVAGVLAFRTPASITDSVCDLY